MNALSPVTDARTGLDLVHVFESRVQPVVGIGVVVLQVVRADAGVVEVEIRLIEDVLFRRPIDLAAEGVEVRPKVLEQKAG